MLDRMLHLRWYEIDLLVWPSKQMVCSRRFRVLSRDKRGAPNFLAFSNFNHTLDKGAIMERTLLCIFPRISSILRSYFYFSSSNDLLKIGPFSWLGSSCLVQDVLHSLRCEDFSLGCITQTVCLHKMQAQMGVSI